MSKPSLRNHLVSLDRRVYVRLVDSKSHSHDHVLRSLNDLAIYFQEVALLESLVTEEVVVKVSCGDDG